MVPFNPMPIPIEMEFTVYKCKRCGEIIGATSATILIIGAVKIRTVFKFQCTSCRRFLKWRPGVQAQSENISQNTVDI